MTGEMKVERGRGAGTHDEGFRLYVVVRHVDSEVRRSEFEARRNESRWNSTVSVKALP